MTHPFRSAIIAVVLVAAAGYADSKDEQVAQHIKNLRADDAKARKNAADGIGKIAQVKASAAKPALLPLIEALEDSDPKVRAAAAAALSKLDEPKDAVPALIRVFKDDKEMPVRIAAATGLGLIGEPAREAVPTLRAAMKDAKSEEQKRLARAAGEAARQIMGTQRKN